MSVRRCSDTGTRRGGVVASPKMTQRVVLSVGMSNDNNGDDDLHRDLGKVVAYLCVLVRAKRHEELFDALAELSPDVTLLAFVEALMLLDTAMLRLENAENAAAGFAVEVMTRHLG